MTVDNYLPVCFLERGKDKIKHLANASNRTLTSQNNHSETAQNGQPRERCTW